MPHSLAPNTHRFSRFPPCSPFPGAPLSRCDLVQTQIMCSRHGRTHTLSDQHRRGVPAGLSAVGVALVAAACKGLVNGACKDNVTVGLCALAAAATIYSSSVYMLPIMLVVGGAATTIYKWKEVIPPKVRVPTPPPPPSHGHPTVPQSFLAASVSRHSHAHCHHHPANPNCITDIANARAPGGSVAQFSP